LQLRKLRRRRRQWLRKLMRTKTHVHLLGGHHHSSSYLVSVMLLDPLLGLPLRNVRRRRRRIWLSWTMQKRMLLQPIWLSK
jgi:hypothetical protein